MSRLSLLLLLVALVLPCVLSMEVVLSTEQEGVAELSIPHEHAGDALLELGSEAEIDAALESELGVDSESELEAECGSGSTAPFCTAGRPSVESLTRVDDVAFKAPAAPWSDADVTRYALDALYETRPKKMRAEEKSTDALANAVAEAKRLLKATSKKSKKL